MRRNTLSFVIFFRVALLVFLYVFSSFPARLAEEPADLLKRSFESAKAALSEGNEDEARRQFERTIALGLRQAANLAVAQSRFDQANRELDEALRFAPADQDISVDAAVASFRAGCARSERALAASIFNLGDFLAAIKDLKAAVA